MRRTPLLLAGLLTVLALAGCGAAEDSSPSEPSPATSASSSSTSAAEPDDGASAAGGTTVITVDTAAQTGRCAVPTPALLEGNDLAFDGEVESIEGGLVTLRPTAVYAGEPGTTVTVRSPSEDLQALLAAVSFQEGGRYLVAAQDGAVALCTVTAPWSKQLAATYEQAFGPPR